MTEQWTAARSNEPGASLSPELMETVRRLDQRLLDREEKRLLMTVEYLDLRARVIALGGTLPEIKSLWDPPEVRISSREAFTHVAKALFWTWCGDCDSIMWMLRHRKWPGRKPRACFHPKRRAFAAFWWLMIGLKLRRGLTSGCGIEDGRWRWEKA